MVVLGNAGGGGSGCVEEGNKGGVASDGGGNGTEDVGEGLVVEDEEVLGDGVLEEGTKVLVGDGPVGEITGGTFDCGVPVNRSGTIEGRQVNDVVLDTGCSQTMIRQDLLPLSQQTTGRTVQIRCSRGCHHLPAGQGPF